MITPSLCDPALDQGSNTCESWDEHPHEHTIDVVYLCSTFLYYLFAYDDAQEFEWSMLYENKSINRTNGCLFNVSAWNLLLFDSDNNLNSDIYSEIPGLNNKQEVVVLHSDRYSDNISFLSCDFYFVLLLDLMSFSEMYLPICVENTFIFNWEKNWE